MQRRFPALAVALLAAVGGLVLAAVAAAEPPDVLFTVLHSPVQPEQKLQRVEAVLDTWGAGQRVVVVTGDADEQPVRGTPVWHIANTTGAMSEVAVRTYLQRAMQESWDWLMHVDDNSLVLPPNLHNLLESYDASVPTIIGSKLGLPGTDKIFFTSGPGWVVSRPAVQLFLDNWCPPANAWFRDTVFLIQMHTCMANALHVVADSARDEANMGALFNTYGPVRSFKGAYDEWFRNYKLAVKEHIVTGAACCARYPVSFHYLSATEIRVLHRMLMEPSQWRSMGAEQQAKLLRSDVGPYSKRVDGADDPVLDWLTSHFRVHGVGAS